MRITTLIQLGAALVIIAASTGQLPKILHQVRLAQLHLVKDSQASNWGKPFLLPVTR